MRVTARETAFKIVFASLFSGEVDWELAKQYFKSEKLDRDDMVYAKDILECVSAHKEEFSKIIDEYSRSFPESRVFLTDKSIMYVALAEILYRDDIPDVISISEAANIAGKYSSEKSPSYVSGLLGQFVKERK